MLPVLYWLPLKSKQRPIQPKKPPLAAVVPGVAPGVATCAEAKPIITKVKVAGRVSSRGNAKGFSEMVFCIGQVALLYQDDPQV